MKEKLNRANEFFELTLTACRGPEDSVKKTRENFKIRPPRKRKPVVIKGK